MATKARFTAEDLLQMEGDDGRRELVHGELIEMPLNNALHGRLAIRLGRRLDEYVEKANAGTVLTEVGFVLHLPEGPEQVRGPDLAFVSKQRLPKGPLPQKFIQGPPDLAVEILSPSDKSAYLHQKIRDYLEAGTRLIWIIAPEVKTATVYRPDGSARLVRENEKLEGEDILPGLTIPLAELFR